MIEITLKCETLEEARTYLNAPNYLNLIQDFYEAVRAARKHGTDEDVLFQIKNYFAEFATACEHSNGAY